MNRLAAFGLVTLLSGAGASSAAPHPSQGPLLGLVGELCDAVSELEHALVHAPLAPADRSELLDEMEDVLRGMDRLERDLSRPVRHGGDALRLASDAQRVERETLDLLRSVSRAQRRGTAVYGPVAAAPGRGGHSPLGVALRVGVEVHPRGGARAPLGYPAAASAGATGPACGALESLRGRAYRVASLASHLAATLVAGR